MESITITYKQAEPVFSKTVSYTYDLSGRKASYTNSEQQIYSYRYTPHGRLAGVSIPDEGSISFQDFNWLMPQGVLFPGGNQYSLSYNGLQRYEGRVLKDAAGNPILSWQYDYDAVGNITAIEDQSGKTTYGYDKLYRLTEAKYPEGDGRQNEAYAYDGVGNRLDEASSKGELDITQWQYNAHNQLVSHDGIGYRYNRDGHLIERGALQVDGSLIQSGAIDHWLYQYDARERLVAVQKNGQLLARYTYNPLGQRISKTLPQQGTTIYYLYSEEGLVGEYDAQGELQQEYAYGPTAPWMSQPLFTRAKAANAQGLQVHYYGTSHLGTPEVAFLKSGEVTWRAKAQAFGETTVTLSALNNPLRFPGQYFDQETGLHYNFFRDYDPSLGRYVQSDPVGFLGGVNGYSYASLNPMTVRDVFGLAPGDLFETAHDAALDAGRYARSFKNQQIEYGGWVYEVDGCWTYTFMLGEAEGPNGEPPNVPGDKLAATRPKNSRLIWHTHPNRGDYYHDENFSGMGVGKGKGDLDTAKENNYGIYLNTPSGRNLYADPNDANPETRYQYLPPNEEEPKKCKKECEK